MARRAPFDFVQRTALARTYLDDGAPFSAARILEELAKDIREAGEARNRTIEAELEGKE
ncbi:hypothetical protein HOU02_gp301 [Caulobacter phage CcrBL9]|uniref:Uncharacterized protein n=1 Tax=Caulobacter phage CcrBL9 TaxID=2283270 RepID=A0A385EC08_9CAUD|nr:hypothetical protein HOU02_gp301 [Caulobacter phage CcrBL9]AXQ69424.1 hypothetical protein CcrBL9_gp400 [Caulobacter phage CcrBL9]